MRTDRTTPLIAFPHENRCSMDIERFKQQHVQILQIIHRMRELAAAGVAENASGLAREIRLMKSKVALHLSIENDILYPRLEKRSDGQIARLAREYREEMTALADGFGRFVERWGAESALGGDPEGFRSDCNTVLKALHRRIQRENTEFYPQVEAL
ncbi:hemerythrin domain-containing protein [Castellaniella sp.]|uniref:hemerythrin domain-containing protein n=2 Tax=Castellaniella sp. TaxID=1955812 RepID=UPI002AFFFD13|nr:hemerythrin domain-containing protein [Castellaniella sp.]